MANLLDTFRALFPARTEKDPFDIVPLLPADLFAFCAYTLDASGACHHIAPDVPDLGHPWRRIKVTDQMRVEAQEVGKAWREGKALRQGKAPAGRLPPVPDKVKQLWKQLGRFARHEVFVPLDTPDPIPAWWETALCLIMIADEASSQLGFDSGHPFFKPILFGLAENDDTTANTFLRIQRAPHTLSTAARTIVCVQAKSLTASVGCTLRSLTHHLALLPGQGQARARWISSPFKIDKSDQTPETELGLLLVPFPYRIVDGCFKPAGEHAGDQWGWFDVEQRWLPPPTSERRREFVIFVRDLVAHARKKNRRVNGVVLPELALDYALFAQLAHELALDPEIDFLISGISRDRYERHGNFVATAPFFLLGKERKGLKGLADLLLVREKHHRWKLTKPQIETYGLDTDLAPDKKWWEHLTILGRSVDVLSYRDDTTLTTLICEDLARVDPCQALLRAIGPNLVIALLMDGPQLPSRWPARYATVLAEDPGSSVLSFTSFGLIARQNDKGDFGQSATVGLWKDEMKGVKPLDLPREADALHLTLNKTEKNEYCLDGRSDGSSAHRWEYGSVIGVRSSRLSRASWIFKGQGRLRPRPPHPSDERDEAADLAALSFSGR